VTLLYWARTRAELSFADEVRALAARHANLVVQFVLTREASLSPGEHRGRLDADQLSTLVPDLDRQQVYACGPGGFVDTARSVLAERVQHFQAEAFSPPPRRVDEQGEVQVTLARRGRTLNVARGQSLLTALEAAGIHPASGCRMGICNTCACGKTSGQARHVHTGAVVDEPVSALKLCVHSAASDLVLDL
jgi:ferredoxin